MTAGQVLPQSATDQGSPLPSNVRSTHIHFGRDVVLTGNAPSSSAGHTVELRYAAVGQRTWSALSSGTIRSDGAYRVAAPVRHSGLVEAVDTSSTSQGTRAATSSTGAARHVAVTASIHLRRRSIDVLGAEPVHVRGRLLPGVSGRRVRLEARSGRGWQTLTTAMTGARGGFDLRYVASAPGQQQLRVHFAGDRLNTHSGAPAGQITVYRQSLASWYNDGGTTGCGFHAYYGVANRDLPCGTTVTFYNGGRTVTATVDDRGPYVGGRDWDLNQNTAAALGFGGVGAVWSSL